MVDTVEIPLLDERQLTSLGPHRAGRIGFDDRGNAIYEWKQPSLTVDGQDAAQLRAEALDHPGLAIVDDVSDDAALGGARIKRNPSGLRVGYNPYESGQLDRKQPRKPHDLRELSRWIQLKRKLSADR